MKIDPARVRPTAGDQRHRKDARRIALDCMLTALEHLDRDAEIPPIVGSQLQLAIDRLRPSITESPGSIERR